MKNCIKIFIVIFSSFFLFINYLVKVKAVPIGPDKYYIDAKKGETYQKILTIYGKQDMDQEQKLYVSAVGMKKTGEMHERNFYIPNSKDKNEAANWINIKNKEITVSPGYTIEVNWEIKIPDELSVCGTNLAALMVSNNPLDFEDTDNTSVDVSKEVISQIHLNLPDIPNQECNINLKQFEFYVNKKKFLKLIKIFNYDEVPFVAKIENSGKKLAHSPKGFIEIFGFGDRISIPFNDKNLDIYPESIRHFDNIWIDEDYPRHGNFFQKFIYELAHLRIGRYKARLGITKNINSQIIAYDTFWIIPWRVILVFSIPLMIIAILIYIIIKNHYKNKNEAKINKK